MLLLFGKLTKKKGKREKSHKRNITPSIFNFIGSLSKEDVIKAVKIILYKYHLTEWKGNEPSYILAKVPFLKLFGLCYTIKLVVKNLCRLIDELVPDLAKILISILRISIIYYCSEQADSCKKMAHTLYIESIKRLKDLYSRYYETGVLDSITENLVELLKAKIEKMKDEQAQVKSNLLDIFILWSTNPKYLQRYFVSYPIVFDSIITLLTANKIGEEVCKGVFQILQNLLFLENEDIMGEGSKRVCESLFKNKIDFIIECIHCYLSKPDSLQIVNNNMFAILSELVVYLNSNTGTVNKLIDLLIPHIFLVAKKQKQAGESFILLIRTLKTLFEKYQNPKLNFFYQFSPLLLRSKSLQTRYEISELLTILSGEDQEILKYSQIAQKMNSFEMSKKFKLINFRGCGCST